VSSLEGLGVRRLSELKSVPSQTLSLTVTRWLAVALPLCILDDLHSPIDKWCNMLHVLLGVYARLERIGQNRCCHVQHAVPVRLSPPQTLQHR
jgi:hypothetical protein